MNCSRSSGKTMQSLVFKENVVKFMKTAGLLHQQHLVSVSVYVYQTTRKASYYPVRTASQGTKLSGSFVKKKPIVLWHQCCGIQTFFGACHLITADWV